ncbi:alpha/beta fold hydrolase [Micromonospora cathayae]|uniref:Alpha/beta hydrolase n=1 Tax=Micromonospora cathayae TaxID=3028804 RepID=A0ABY7ZK83_9ACTN|nr:alpha/beta hydrolase [Micromonospora sp. HUAS 3]WDZ83325.1 alpha/beta hydrolase [Micromonospora sp. HUAS 3]
MSDETMADAPVPAGRTRRMPRRSWRMAAGAAVTALALLTTAAGVSVAAERDERGKPERASAAALGSGFREGRVGVDGGYLHYVKGGTGAPLVLLHGWPQTWWSWHTVMPELAKTRTVIALDLPGLGSSSIPSGGYDKKTTAKRINQAVRALGYTKVDLLTHDSGSLIAYPYAVQFPEQVGRIAVIEAPLSGFGLEDFYGVSWHFLFNASPAPIPETIMDNDDVSTYLGMLFNNSHRPDLIDKDTYYRAYSDPARRTAGYNYYRAFDTDIADNRASAAAGKVSTPILAMGAQYVFGPAVAASYRNVGTDVREVVAPASGHFVPEENPQFLLDCVKLFFGPAGGVPSRPELANCAP